MAKPKLEVGMYREAAKHDMTLSDWLEWKATTNAGRGENWDWYNPELKDLDAFEQLLMHYGIRVRGEKASTADAFFYDPNARVLFPEFLAREFRFAEQEGTNELRIQDIIASRVGVNTGAYRSEYLEEGQDAALQETGEGAHFPTIVLKYKEHPISLTKYGAVLKMTYEAVRRSRLDHLATFVRKIALDTRRAKVRRAVEVLINGDGNSNPAPDVSTGHAAPFTFEDIVDLELDFTEGFEPQVLVADKGTVMRQILKMDIFTAADATARGANFRDTGQWPMPLGKELRYVEKVDALTNKLLGVDRRYALEEVYEEGAELVETERLITTQFESIVFSEVVGYAKLFTGAARTRTLS